MKEKILTLGKTFIQHELVNNSIYIFVGTMIGNLFAFLLNLFLARNLSYIDYGIFASLLSITTLASIPATSVNTILVRFSSEYYIKAQLDKLKSLYEKSSKIIFLFAFFVLVLFTVFSPAIKIFLHLDNILYVIAVGFCVAIGYIQILNSGFLQGLLKFGYISFVNMFSGFIKLIVGIALAWLGFKALSGLWAISFMSLSAFLIAFIPLRFIFSAKADSEVRVKAKEILPQALPIFFTILFMTSFTSSDVILVKHFLSPTLAGYYSGLSLVGRVIVYFTATIPLVMFPLIVKRNVSGRGFIGLFSLAVLLVLLPSLSLTIFYGLFPSFVITLFLGGRSYLLMAPYLWLFGLFITVYSVVNVFVNFFLSVNKVGISFIVVGAAVLQIILLYTFHTNFYQIIGISISVCTLLLIILLFIFLKNYVKLMHIKKITSFIIPSI